MSMTATASGNPVPVSKPVPAIVMQAQQQWDQVVNELTKLAMEEDKNALAMGDLFVKIEEQWGRDKLKAAAASAGVEWQKARQRHWISTSIPPNDAIRKMMLPYTHLRHLAGVKGAEERLQWAKLAVENDWTATKLREEIDKVNDKQAQEQGVLCASCSNPIKPSDRMVTLRVIGQKAERCCSIRCGRDRLEELSLQEAELPEREPTESELDLDASHDPLDDE